MLLPICAVALYTGVEMFRGRRPALLDLLPASRASMIANGAVPHLPIPGDTPLGLKAERVQTARGITTIETLGSLSAAAATIRATQPGSKVSQRDGVLTVTTRDQKRFVVRPFRTANSDAGFVEPDDRDADARAVDDAKPSQAALRTDGDRMHAASNDAHPAVARNANSVRTIASGGHAPEIVLILDDVGFDHQPLASAMQIDPNVNFAVLPNGQRSTEFARELDQHGFEILCHLPMEPLGFPRVSPGPGAVLTSMSDREIATATLANVQAIPQARGVNNHMGSRATTDRRVMNSVMGALPKGMYFIDSRTTGNSLAGKVAHEMNIRTASRNVFLDDVRSEAAIRRQLAELATTAETHGHAVGIGHMFPETVRVLNAEAPLLRGRGFRFVRASSVVD
jgi:polysaccharide deacetylase 2 family uncharacterized protein YibQ